MAAPVAPAGTSAPQRELAGAPLTVIHSEAVMLATHRLETELKTLARALERALREFERINALLGRRQ